MSSQPELPAEALDYGTANGFTVSEMRVGEGVRWTPGVAV
jgi:homoserine kinase